MGDFSADGILELEPMDPYSRLLLHRLADIFGYFLIFETKLLAREICIFVYLVFTVTFFFFFFWGGGCSYNLEA